MNKTIKNKIKSNKSYSPVKVYPDAYGNKNTSSISYNKKNTHNINKIMIRKSPEQPKKVQKACRNMLRQLISNSSTINDTTSATR